MAKTHLRKWGLLFCLPLFAMTAGLDAKKTKALCTGILEDHNYHIPIMPMQVGGVSEAEFNKVLDKFENHFAPVVARYGARLEVKRDWRNSMVNATAFRVGNRYQINMYGGLARHPTITRDGLMLVACHELGHHIGGAPKRENYWGGSMDWASNEGQSDYYATLRCLREVWTAQENFAWYESATIDRGIKEACERTWNTQEEEQLCMRSAMAGKSVANMFKATRSEREVLSVDTPDRKVVTAHYHGHPATQCRMDTYFQGALCVHDTRTKLSDSNPKTGTCSGRYDIAYHGSRPRCWFNAN